jgi:hypothetical protein
MRQQNLNNISLQSLNIAVESWATFYFEDEDIHIPLYIHIKDIREFHENTILYKMDILSHSMRKDETKSPFEEEMLEYKSKEVIKEYKKFIDHRPMFDGKPFLEALDFDLFEELNRDNLSQLITEIDFYIAYVRDEFINKCKELFDYDRKFPKHYKPKDDKMPQDVKDNCVYPMGMTLVQGYIEYPSNIIFPENMGKPVAEHSFREIQLKAMYLHMKNKIEGFLNEYQGWKMEKDRPKPKKE